MDKSKGLKKVETTEEYLYKLKENQMEIAKAMNLVPMMELNWVQAMVSYLYQMTDYLLGYLMKSDSEKLTVAMKVWNLGCYLA